MSILDKKGETMAFRFSTVKKSASLSSGMFPYFNKMAKGTRIGR